MLTLKRISSRAGIEKSTQPAELLVWLGVPKSKVYSPVENSNAVLAMKRRNGGYHFWERNQWELLDLLREAKKEWRESSRSTPIERTDLAKPVHNSMPSGPELKEFSRIEASHSSS